MYEEIVNSVVDFVLDVVVTPAEVLEGLVRGSVMQDDLDSAVAEDAGE